MEYRETQPSVQLRGHVKRFWSLEYESTGYLSDPEVVLPDGCPEIVFNLSDRFTRLHADFDETQPAALFAGQMSRSISIRPTGKVSLFGVRFHPAGAFPMVGVSMHELTDHIVDLRYVIGHYGRELEERIAAADGFDDRVRVFEDLFRRKLAGMPSEDKVAHVAAAIIVKSGGLVSISNVADMTGVTERRLERNFRTMVGITPKMLARTVRFQNVVGKIQAATDSSLLDAALSFGYFDQSHMINEFRGFAGQSPIAFFERSHRLSALFTNGE